MPTFLIERKYQTHLDMILPTMKTLAMSKKDHDQPKLLQNGITDYVNNQLCRGTELRQKS
jgi:hypothetical protein